MTDRFIDVILEAIADIKEGKNLRVSSDDLSTMLIGTSEKIFTTLETCFMKAAQKADHVVMTISFSKGCPGEPDDPCCHPENALPKDLTQSKQTHAAKKASGIPVSAQFALYPLNDPKYMDHIYTEIEEAKKIVSVKPKHFCTRLDGDMTDVFTVLRNAFDAPSRETSHVVMTATISKKGKIS